MPRDAQTVEALASDLKHRINQARDIVNNDVYYQREVAILRKNFEDAQKRLERFEDLRANGLKYIDEWKQQLVELRSERIQAQNANTISKLKDTLEQINDLTSPK